MIIYLNDVSDECARRNLSQYLFEEVEGGELTRYISLLNTRRREYRPLVHKHHSQAE